MTSVFAKDQLEINRLRRELHRLREALIDAKEMLDEPHPCPRTALFIIECALKETKPC